MENNDAKGLSAILKNIYNDKPMEVIKQPREKSRRFFRIGKRLKKKQQAMSVDTKFEYRK